MDTLNALLGILFIPLLASLVIVLLGSKRSKAGPLIAIFASIGLLLLTLSLISNGIGEAVRFSWEWFRFGDHSFELGFLFDNVSATMLAMIAVVGLCITLFSLGYMSDDQAKGRFFAGLSFFMFSMLGIVLADNLIMIFVFWELVGFSSYMLIGHYFQNEEAKLASKKAFIVNRIGDFGFLLGILLTFWQFGTTNIEAIAMAVGMDAKGNADKINSKGAPDPEGNRNRHFFQNQVCDFPVPEKTFAKIKNEVVPEHLQEADVNRFIESVHSLDFLNQLWIEPLGTTVF